MPDRAQHSKRRFVCRALSSLVLLCACAGNVAADDPKALAYGRHLAQECTSCHKLDGSDSGIPSIIGRPAEEITAMMEAFQSGARTNPAMVSVAQSLDGDQVRALAIYLASLGNSDRQSK